MLKENCFSANTLNSAKLSVKHWRGIGSGPHNPFLKGYWRRCRVKKEGKQRKRGDKETRKQGSTMKDEEDDKKDPR
jgi:hypothetical protein